MKIITFILPWFLLVLPSCSQKAENAGLCSLNCSKAIIGPIEGKIELMAQSSGVTCSVDAANTALSDPLTFYFLVSDSFDNDGVERATPLPSVSIEPIVNGLTSGLAAHNPNVEIDGNTYTPAHYKGIITPKENWCSDNCGVAFMEVFAVCPPPGEVSNVNMKLHSGALFSDDATVSIQTQDDF